MFWKHSRTVRACTWPRIITLLELSLESSGTVIANRQLEVIDGAIEEFRNVLSEKQKLLTTMTADPAYVDLARALVTSAETQAKLGQIDLATETLNAIPESGWIKPQGSTFYQWIIVGVLGIIAAVAVFLLLKTRSEISFLKSQATVRPEIFRYWSGKLPGPGIHR